jgi:hypothetical protein
MIRPLPKLLCFMTLLATSPVMAKELVLVDGGKANAVIVCEEPSSKYVSEAVHELQWHLEKATDVKLPILKSGDPIGSGLVAIRIGDGPAAKAAGIESSKLKEEEFQIKSSGNNLYIVGRDIPNPNALSNMSVVEYSPATMWAVDYILDHYVGVRWLWPGELGAHVPKVSKVVIPELDVTWQPICEHRDLPMRFGDRFKNNAKVEPTPLLSAEEQKQVVDEASLWLRRMRTGQRSSVIVSHSFEKWEAKYYATHPEWFAKEPAGYKGEPLKFGWRKLCNSNADAIAQMIVEWKEAGMPDTWGVAPNDGTGFCTCDACVAMDEEKAPLDKVHAGKINLTPRHVKWWGRIQAEFQKHRADIRLKTIAYGAYRVPPAPEMKFGKGFIFSTVFAYDEEAKKDWKSWQQFGAQIGLRPNWWHQATHAPYMPFRQQGEFFKFAQANGLIGFRFDELKGAFGVQGLNYYMIARLQVRPDLEVEQIVDEYTSAFGPAKSIIDEYLNYWEAYTKRAAYPNMVGGAKSQGIPSLYEDAVKNKGLHPHPLAGSFPALVHLYTDDIMKPAHEILDRADKAVASAPQEFKDRVQFLRDGLRQMEQTRDTIKLGMDVIKHKKPLEKEFLTAYKKLREMRREMTFRHVVWGDNDFRSEERRHAATFPQGHLKDASWEGM